MRRLLLPQIYLVLLVGVSAVSIIVFTLSSVNIFQNPVQYDCGRHLKIPAPPAETVQPSSSSPTLCSNLPNNLFQIAEFRFLKLSNDLCAGSSSSNGDLIVIVVHSGINNTKKRDVIRSTWGSVKRFKNWTFELVFILGNPTIRPTRPSDSVADSAETVDHASLGVPVDINERDIVVGDFIDSYRNLTLKHLVAYKWVGEYCPRAKYVLKVDDDVHLDIFHLTQIIEESEPKGQPDWSIIGNLMSGYGPERATDSKAVVLSHEYPRDKYPDYVSGLAYVIKTQAACQIFASHSTQDFLWIDDVFVTGILREAVGLAIKGINSKYFFAPLLQGSGVSDWYSADENSNPPPYVIILDSSDFGSNMWERFGKVWAKMLRNYTFRPGHGFNEF